jgi:hypothetical protein
MRRTTAFGLLMALVAGCEPEPRTVGNTAKNTSAPAPAPTPPPPTPEESKPRSTLGERTTDIRDAQAEQEKGGVATPPKIVSRDPIRIVGNAYVSIIGQASVMKIKHALDIFKTQNERYPNDTQEFMEQVIQANNIALPRLPYYQEYAYDAQTHALVIMEYPARKEAREKELAK